ncbi:sensor histidine kinase [Oceanobacillus bengalensis]|uniref:Circadian input-output histidine kinase CikA n=1 Tax=Oceanobacillus bengalensis TaxID=1435466 RepID=A0A494Z733_9BACI|nr:HAMP domain-containing sensor histidine kinase [Oceanobacillus bengalensis]RKQ18304.1 sensor histidine kinase [Oceanobacillus bengalensis]
MNRIVLKLGIIMMGLILAVLLPLGFVADKIFSNFYYNQITEEISELSHKYASSITSLDDDAMINMFKSLAYFTNKDIYITNAIGEVIAHTGIQIPLTNNELRHLSKGKSVQKNFEDRETSNTYLSYGHPIVFSDTFEGSFFVLTSVDDAHEPAHKIRDLLILSAVGAFFVGLGITFFLARKMSKPLIEMERATREIARGNLDIRVNTIPNDELGSLGKAINDLAVETNEYRTNRSELFANISHELRTPITYLKGYANALKNNLYKTEEEKQQYLTIIETESDHILRLINDLFDLSKMEEGQANLQRETVNLLEIVETSILKIKIELEKKGLKLVTEINRKSDLLIYADGIRVEQIFINLLVNAIQYTEKGSICMKVWGTKNNVHIVIEDTGIGIPEEDLPLVFERFHRVEKSRSRDYGGTGLGLAIVKNLVEIQDGNITVSSKRNKGTKFELSFPRVE